MAGEPVGKQEICDLRMRSDDCVVVERVVFVVAGPGATGLDRLEGWNARGKRWPYDVLEQRPVRFEIVALGSTFAKFVLGPTGDVDGSFWPHPDAGRIDHQGHVVKLLTLLEYEDRALARLDRKHEPGHRGQLAAIRASRVDDHVCFDLRAV